MAKFGLLGKKLSHSISPLIHDIIFDITGFCGTYELYEMGEVTNIYEIFNDLDLLGLNVTIPYKENVKVQLKNLTKEAIYIGAVNTILKKEAELIGSNTDYYGFKEMLQVEEIDISGKRVAILGTGGAAKTVEFYAKKHNAADIFYISRTPDKTKQEFSYEDLKNMRYEILVNTTPVGMYPNILESPVDIEVIKNADVLIDLIYNPHETKFLKLGREHGKICCNGLYMLIAQAIKAQEIWQNLSFDEEIIKEIHTRVKHSLKIEKI